MKIIILLVVFSVNLFAGEKGNGGDVIVCPNGSVELYDHYEGRVRDGRTLDLGPESLSIERKVELVIERIKTWDPRRAAVYLSLLNTFQAEAEFLSGIDLIDIPDTGDGYIPANCTLKQLVVQLDRPDPFRNNKRYIINLDYWNRLSNSGKAGTILHEIILREAIENRHQDSRAARYLNNFFSDANWSRVSWVDYAEVISKARMYWVGNPWGFLLTSIRWTLDQTQTEQGIVFHQVNVTTSESKLISFHLDGEIVEGKSHIPDNFFIFRDGLSPIFSLNTFKVWHSLPEGWTISSKKVLVSRQGPLEFSTLGSLKKEFAFHHPSLAPEGCYLELETTEVPTGYPMVHFGRIDKAYLPLKTEIFGKKCHAPRFITNLFIGSGELEFVDPSRARALLSYHADGVAFPRQKIRLRNVDLKILNGKFSVVKMETNGLNVNDRTPQRLLNHKLKYVTVPSYSRITVNEEGLLLTCQTPGGSTCRKD